MKIINIENQKNLLFLIKRQKNALQLLETNLKYNQVYRFGTNII